MPIRPPPSDPQDRPPTGSRRAPLPPPESVAVPRLRPNPRRVLSPLLFPRSGVGLLARIEFRMHSDQDHTYSTDHTLRYSHSWTRESPHGSTWPHPREASSSSPTTRTGPTSPIASASTTSEPSRCGPALNPPRDTSRTSSNSCQANRRHRGHPALCSPDIDWSVVSGVRNRCAGA